MKGTKKKLLGLLGLFLVAAITTFAVLMPQPGVAATSSVTDTISVRVVGEVPKVGLSGIENESITKNPNQTFTVDYENVEEFTVTVKYTDLDGNEHTYTLEDKFNADYNPGTKQYTLNLNEERFGHGDYEIHVSGKGYGAENITEDVVTFTYSEFRVDVETGKDGNPIVDPGVDPEDHRVDHVVAEVEDPDGNPVPNLTTEFEKPFSSKELFFNEHEPCLKTGDYTIKVKEYDAEGNLLHEHDITYHYEALETCEELLPVPSAGSPNTGQSSADFNVSRVDYLITGIIALALVAVLGIFFVLKRGKKTTHKRR